MNTQVVLITGGLTGIRRAAAIAFAKKGAKLSLTGVPMRRLGLSEELPTRSYSTRGTKLHTSPAISSTSTAVTALTDVRREGISTMSNRVCF
jgi:NAD(P)-dependent dehydrogenase (short-subunit alcohol dehydrogenase family)